MAPLGGSSKITAEQSTGAMQSDSMITVLEVVAEFEPLEPDGVSTGLIAWELNKSERLIEPVMHHARDRGMIERIGWDFKRGERLWRLTDHGRARIAAAEA
jgi:hypothetical protein